MPSKPRARKLAATGTMDAYSNPAANLGWGSTSINEGTQYLHTQLSQNYLLLLSLYRSDWICRKVIDTVPEDMLRKWISVRCDVTLPDLDLLGKIVDETYTVPQLLEALQWARLFGGSGALMVINGQEDLSQPLNLDEVELGDYRGLLVFDRWSGIQGSMQTIDSLENPSEYGLPALYTLTTSRGSQMTVHHSRILRFNGRKLPLWERQTVQGWGMSELELIYDPLRQYDNTAWGIAQLVHRANLLVKTVPGLDQALATGNQQQLQRLQNVIREQMSALNNQGVWMLNGGGPEEREELQAHQYSFGGLNDVQQNFMVAIAGACEIPYSRLFQRTVTGLGQTNEGDEQIYYDMVAQKQKRELGPQLRKLLPVIAKSAWGDIPNDLDFVFNPLQEMNAKEKVELAKTRTDAILAVLNSQTPLISAKSALIELKAGADETGVFAAALTNDVINAADDTVQAVQNELQMPDVDAVGEESKQEDKQEE